MMDSDMPDYERCSRCDGRPDECDCWCGECCREGQDCTCELDDDEDEEFIAVDIGIVARKRLQVMAVDEAIAYEMVIADARLELEELGYEVIVLCKTEGVG